MPLPTTMQSRVNRTPLGARVMLAGMPKVGKTSLLAEWAPKTTLIIDTHDGTKDLPGEHYVAHVKSWPDFEATVAEIARGGHPFETIGLDLADDLYRMADLHAAQRKGLVAAGLIEYGKGTAEAEGLFRREVGKLFASPYGIWFLSHTDTEENDRITRYVPRLDKRVRTYVEGACSYIFLAETLGPKRVLHTQPTAKFQAGSRTPMPDPMDLNARELYAAMAVGLAVDTPAAVSEPEPAAETETTTTERVAA